MRRTVEILLNLIEQLKTEIKELRAENQQLKDENNRLKGEQGQPDIKARSKGLTNNHSSEKERQTPKKHNKGSKNGTIKINREQIFCTSSPPAPCSPASFDLRIFYVLLDGREYLSDRATQSATFC
ncbi:hypothetical protein VB735_23160 [Halotia wernerae UHCC 0503]|nr:hypothetical protein [Halotia wernerae UHCC 0503]